jgi:gamma-glutamylcyclotransferase (GGCT)/AIG2-like uncharacterized protein YtfP
MSADDCLAVYGSLAPGRPNHHELSALRGEWSRGKVKGRFVARGWGAALGFPALVLSKDGDDIEVQLFQSPDLPDHWERLDAFEGAEYRRTLVQVETAGGLLDAWIYLDAHEAA